MLVRVVAPHFVAGLVFDDGPGELAVCTHAAPILRYMVGWRRYRVRSWIANNRWDESFVAH